VSEANEALVRKLSEGKTARHRGTENEDKLLDQEDGGLSTWLGMGMMAERRGEGWR